MSEYVSEEDAAIDIWVGDDFTGTVELVKAYPRPNGVFWVPSKGFSCTKKNVYLTRKSALTATIKDVNRKIEQLKDIKKKLKAL